mgnify:FL=1
MNDEIIAEINEELSRKIDMKKDYSDDEILELVEQCVFEKSKTYHMSFQMKKQLINSIFNSKRRLDVLQPLLDDGEVSEIMVNGPKDIFTERRGRISRENVKFENEERLFNIIQTIVSKVNRTVNEANPIVDARLQDGSRVNVVLPPIALNGPVVTIRKFPEKPLTMEDLIRIGSITREAAKFLEALVKAKYNIFIAGGTGSGKTTLLNALSNYIPSHERIITIEDSAELQIRCIDNIVRLETRNANTEGKGQITIRDLIRTSLRMRPDRIIVGEIRGAEALDMLQAMNTGHDGSLSTGHANSAKDMLTRMETMVLCGALLPLDAIRHQIASAIDILIYLGRVRDMSRKVLEISEITGIENGSVKLQKLYEFVEEPGDSSRVRGKLVRTGNKLLNTSKLKMSGVSIEGE